MKILSKLLFQYNVIIVFIIRVLNSYFIKKEKDRSTVIFNIQYIQRYSVIEIIYASFLKSLGYNVKAFICAGYSYCEQDKSYLSKPNCNLCRSKTAKLIAAADIEKVDLLNFKSKKSTLNYEQFEFKNYKKIIDYETKYPIGETFYWNWLHHTNGYLIPENDLKTKKKLYDIYCSVSESYYSIKESLKKYQPKYVITCNGRFGQTRPIYFLKNKFSYDCLTWEHFAQRDHFVWLKNKCAVDQDISNYWEKIRDKKLDEKQISKTHENLDTQKKGVNIKWNILKNIDFDENYDVYKALNLDKKKSVISMFLNMTWDSSCLAHGIEEMNFHETTDYIIKNAIKYPNLQFVIRAHPAEANLPQNLKASVSTIDFLKSKNNKLPKNVYLIDSKSNISSYKLSTISDEAMFFSSTLGLEVLLQNKKITTLGGRCYYAMKGFTRDITKKSELLNFFNSLNTSNKKFGKRGSLENLSQKEIRRVNTLAFFIRFNLNMRFSVIRRGILLLTPDKYKTYLATSNNLLQYMIGKRLPFKLSE